VGTSYSKGEHLTDIAKLLDALAAASPEFERARVEHIEFNEGLLPYVLLEDFLRPWLAALATADPDRAMQLLALIEAAYLRGDEALQTLIAITLLEGLGQDPSRIGERQVRLLLGPALLAEAERMEAWRR
jgi:hypothetical protein